MYEVLDLHYTPDEGQSCFSGTLEECEAYKKEQCKCSPSNEFMLTVVPVIVS